MPEFGSFQDGRKRSIPGLSVPARNSIATLETESLSMRLEEDLNNAILLLLARTKETIPIEKVHEGAQTE